MVASPGHPELNVEEKNNQNMLSQRVRLCLRWSGTASVDWS